MNNPLRVLIVEDEPTISLSMELMLEDEGHVVVGCAYTYEEAIAAIRDKNPNLVLVDVRLQEQDVGLNIATVLRNHPAIVVFITANVTKIPGDLAGAVGVITKPFRTVDMIALIKYLHELSLNQDKSCQPSTTIGQTIPNNALIDLQG